MCMKKLGRAEALSGYAPLKTLVSEHSDLDILAPLVLMNEEEINAELHVSIVDGNSARAMTREKLLTATEGTPWRRAAC